METLGHQKREYISALPRALRALVRTDIYSRFWRPNISIAHRAECICIYILASVIFQICVLLERTYLLTRRFVCLVKVIPLALRVQVPAHLVRLEQRQIRRGLNVVILTWFNVLIIDYAY